MEKWRSRVSREYQRMMGSSSGGFVVNNVQEAKVFTVVPLSEQNREELEQALEGLVGKKVNIVNKIDTSLIAGMVISTADLVIDLSMKTRLQKLSDNIHQKIHEEFTEPKDKKRSVFFGTTA